MSRDGRLDLPLVWLCFCPKFDILNCSCDFEERHNYINPHQLKKFKGGANLLFRGLIIANTYASSMRSRVSFRFQIDLSHRWIFVYTFCLINIYFWLCDDAKKIKKAEYWKGITVSVISENLSPIHRTVSEKCSSQNSKLILQRIMAH